jgi:hypothetical protein
MALVPKERNFARIDRPPWLAAKKTTVCTEGDRIYGATTATHGILSSGVTQTFLKLEKGLAELMSYLEQPRRPVSILT